jgi:hypothetical protein
MFKKQKPTKTKTKTKKKMESNNPVVLVNDSEKMDCVFKRNKGMERN